MENIAQTKVCRKCLAELPTRSFNKRKNGSFRSRCKQCSAQEVRVRAERLAAKGVCQSCGQKPIDGVSKIYCSGCRAKFSNYRSQRRVEGKCKSCGGKVTNGAVACKPCRKLLASRQAAYAARIIASGGCAFCWKEPHMPVSRFCRPCWFKRIACDRLGSTDYAEVIIKIWEQQEGKCALTLESLTPGNGASLDHIVPTSNGGTHDPSNLRWVTREANRAKSDLSDDDFIAMCRKVVAVADAKAATPLRIVR